MKIDKISEFELIDRIKANTINSEGVIKGIGDDAAVLEATVGTNILFCSDMLIEGRHFLRDVITPRELGYKALAVNLSDIASMGGKPKYALLSTGWPKDLEIVYIQEFYEGVKGIAQQFHVSIVGGDTVNSNDIVIDVAVIGEVEYNKAIMRSGAKPGHVLAATGTLGDSATGLAEITQELKKSPPDHIQEYLRKRHMMPEPRVEAGQLLARLGASSMIDISDGLASEINHICAQSDVSAEVIEEAIPISEEARAFASLNKIDVLELALFGGEDYELLFTVPEERWQAVKEVVGGNLNLNITQIGKIIPKVNDENKVCIINKEGQSRLIKAKGYNHFRS
ncbi:thiamine-monophosphate kinase [Desulfitispora alkaliphila]|uniref:thiamine-phosphate kinase n=1 Tax=Desulfitispora alkaliphila TaxID=622674 RepID=UPI003D1DC192